LPSPTTRSHKLIQSIDTSAADFLSDGIFRMVEKHSRRPITTMGTFTQKTHLQLRNPTRNPPTVGPSIKPAPVIPVYKLTALECSSGGNRSASKDAEDTYKKETLNPCSARKKINQPISVLPPAPHAAKVNKTTPMKKIFRRPNRSAKRPPTINVMLMSIEKMF